jgi:A/G-specific adenine glycosylase
MPPRITGKLLDWYAQNARDLPWRGRSDPYAVWVSEIMLQQTRVDTVIHYYQRWMAEFPTIAALAAASQQQILNLWEGLGYYSRARNLHRAAQIVSEEYGGKLPSDIKTLESLPGIGRYTAAAIGSIAFGLDEPALDGNIRRVFSRLFDLTEPARSPAGERRLWGLAGEHLPPGKAGEYNQALMDLGAIICTVRAPDCSNCPVNIECMARAKGVQEERPVRQRKKPIPHYNVTAAIFQRDGQVFIAQRPANGLLGGLWEFPGGKQEPNEELPVCLQREICEELGVRIKVGAPFGVYQHAYTHFRVTLHAFHCTLLDGEPQMREHMDLRWVAPSKLTEYPMGKIDRQIANALDVGTMGTEN